MENTGRDSKMRQNAFSFPCFLWYLTSTANAGSRIICGGFKAAEPVKLSSKSLEHPAHEEVV
jgi:hypothetical protein